MREPHAPMNDDNRNGPRQAPDFTLEDAAGRSVRLSDLRGQPVVLFFVREFT